MSRLRENVACANGEGRLAQRAGLHDNNLDTVGEPEWALIYGKIEHDLFSSVYRAEKKSSYVVW